MFCLFLEFSVSVLHYPVHEHLSRPSYSSFPPSVSLCRESPLIMCPIQFFTLVLFISICFLHLFQYLFIRAVFCPANTLHPPPYPHLKSIYPFGAVSNVEFQDLHNYLS